MASAPRTGWMRLAAVRTGARRGILSAFALTALLASALLGGLIGYLERAETHGARALFAGAPASSHSIRFQTTPAADQAAQEGAARSVFGGILRGGTLPVPEAEVVGERIQWTIPIDPATVTSITIGIIDRLLVEGDDLLAATEMVVVNGVKVDSTADEVTAVVSANTAVLRAVGLVAVILLSVLAVSSLIQVYRLVLSARSEETALLRARGASVSRLSRTAAAEALLIGVPAAGAGAVLASAALWAATGEAPSLLVMGLTGAAVVLTAVVVAGLAARSDARRTRGLIGRDASGRRRPARIAGAVLLLAASGFALSQLLLRGTPLSTDSRGAVVIDPLVAAAPALVVLAVVSLALLVLGPALSLRATLAARRPGLEPALSARQGARRSASYRVAASAVAAGVAAATLASSYAYSWPRLQDSAGVIALGGDVRVASNDTDVLLALPGVEAALPLVTVDGVLSRRDVGLVLTDADALPDFIAATVIGDQLDLSSAPGLVGAEEALPLTGSELSVDVFASMRVAASAGPGLASLGYARCLIEFDARVISPEGEVSTIALGSVDLEAGDASADRYAPLADIADAAHHSVSASFAVPLPSPAEGWRLLEVGGSGTVCTQAQFDVRVDAVNGAPFSGIALVEGYALDDLQNFYPDGYIAGSIPIYASAYVREGDDEVFQTGDVYRGAITTFPPGPAPVAATKTLAQEASLREGDILALRVANVGEIEVEIIALLPAIPGTPGDAGLLADRLTFALLMSRTQTGPLLLPDTVLASADPAATAAAASAAGVDGVSISATQSGGSLRGAIPGALTLGAVGIALLAGVSTLAAALGQIPTRRAETAALRALGVTRRELAASRRRELRRALLLGALAGMIAGITAAVLTVPALTRAAVPDSPSALSPELGLDPLTTVLTLGLLALVSTAVVILAGTAVRRQRLVIGREVAR